MLAPPCEANKEGPAKRSEAGGGLSRHLPPGTFATCRSLLLRFARSAAPPELRGATEKSLFAPNKRFSVPKIAFQFQITIFRFKSRKSVSEIVFSFQETFFGFNDRFSVPTN